MGPRLVITLLTLVGIPGLAEHSPATPAAGVTRPGVLVQPREVSFNGVPRPDVAQALTDTISAALIKMGSYRVFEPTPATQPTRRKKATRYGAAEPETLPLSGVNLPASDFVFAFNLVSDEVGHHLTLKKLKAGSQEVLEVEELHKKGGLDQLLASVPQTLQILESKGRRVVAFPRTQSPAQLREIIRPAVAVNAGGSEYAESEGLRAYQRSLEHAPAQYGGMHLKHVPKALIYQQLGAIEMINDPWKFCIIKPAPGYGPRVNEELDVLYDEDGKPYGKMRIDAVDSGRMVAGFGRTPGHHPLFRGDVVYGWAPPLK